MPNDTTASSVEATNPLEAPLWRKLLGLRVLFVIVTNASLALFFIGWLDDAKLHLHPWIENGIMIFVGLFALIGFLGFTRSLEDLVIHFLPDGGLRRLLLKGDRTPDEQAAEFARDGMNFALLPFVVPAGLIVIVAVLALIVGGGALIGGLFSALFAGWPAWAIVICILLVANLYKK
ncbi:hypothetical protein J7U46_22425 [Pelomonas sp. V22]|uniref:hypothetical protein n=1 Tax=Pelomonas sp. V22 TaxID=2822139 RepID=UPI0024A868E3|nr:hypothetical protein [Pelomonas sp. V22]MDI4635839.1 hypothetical protein [Pelomonas sp. V22]